MGVVQVLDTQLDAHPRDDDEGAVYERRIALNQGDQLSDHQPHRDDPQNAAGHDHPQLRGHCHGDENGIDREREIDQLYFDDGGPERRQAQHGLRSRRLVTIAALLVPEKVRVREV